MNRLRSSFSLTLSLFRGAQKLGQPVPDSNLASELNSSLPQQTHLYFPDSSLWTYSPENGRSVPFFLVTPNCIGVSCFFHSSSVLLTFVSRVKLRSHNQNERVNNIPIQFLMRSRRFPAYTVSNPSICLSLEAMIAERPRKSPATIKVTWKPR